LVEEPLNKMSPPDWNWADFLGIKLAEIIHDFSSVLPVDIVEEIKISLDHAAHSIFRRNVLAGYTNIAVKGGCITAAAGEMLDNPALLRYGTRRLESIVEHFHFHGGFNEYNSPTYLGIVLDVCEIGLRIIKTPEARTYCEQIWELAWKSVADHFHPATRQLCGPQSRSYSDFLSENFSAYLGNRTGLWTQDGTIENSGPPCPTHILERFRCLPISPLQTEHQYINREDGHATKGTTWFAENACLGSVSHGITWHQSRPLLGYWGNTNQASSIRIRVLRDGLDFSSGFVWNAQEGPRVLTAWNFLTDGGDFHPHLDKPEGGIFTSRDLRLRYELKGGNISARKLSDNQFELASGNYRAVIHTMPSLFAGIEIKWQLTIEPDFVAVDGICSLSDEHLNFQNIDEVLIVSGIELLEPEQNPTTTKIRGTRTSDNIQYEWHLKDKLLQLESPIRPVAQNETNKYGRIELGNQ
jgi:hypothetical protein